MQIRNTIRFLLFNSKQELLLMQVVDPTTTRIDSKVRNAFWCTVGGSREANETDIETIERELFEETGLKLSDVEIGPFVWYGKHHMYIRGQMSELNEKFVVIHSKKDEISTDNFTANEKEVITQLEWLNFSDILNHHEPIFPAILKTHLGPILAKQYPLEPIEVNLALQPD